MQSDEVQETGADLVAAKDLNTVEAAKTMGRMVKAGALKKPESSDSSDLD